MLDATLLPLQNDRVRLRPLHVDDADAFSDGAADPAVRQYGHLPEDEYTPASVRAMVTEVAGPSLARGDLAVLAIADAATDDFAGSLVLFDVRDQQAEVGFWVHPDHRGSGVTAGALDLAASFAGASGMASLTARTSPDNVASQYVLEAAGFAAQGRRTGTAPSGAQVELLHFARKLDSYVRLPLRTARLSLRTHRPTDAHWLNRVYSRADVARFLLDEPWTRRRADEQAAQRAEKADLDGASGALSLVVEHAGAPIGDVQLWFTDRENRIAEIGWVLDPVHAGHGFAAEAVASVLALGFDHYGLHRVVAQMDARNTASARLAARVGFQQEAHLRQDWWSKGEWTDTLVFGMLGTDR